MGKMTVKSALVIGVDGYEVSLSFEPAKSSWPGWNERWAKEAEVRVRSALRSIGVDHALPGSMVACCPGKDGLQVRGSQLDLPAAINMLVGYSHLPEQAVFDRWFFGELTLSGNILPVRGALPMVLEARKRGAGSVILPMSNAKEVSAWVNNIEILGFQKLADVLNWLRGRQTDGTSLGKSSLSSVQHRDPVESYLFPPNVRRVLEIATAGGHNLLMIGPPGCGKTLAAQALALMLPGLSFDEARETATVWSAAGLLDGSRQPRINRAFRAPHHTVSYAGLLGGGRPYPRPGEVSLAHRGVLFLDDFPEYGAGVIENLVDAVRRGPVEIHTQDGVVDLPSYTQLVAAANPCPCGHSGDPRRACKCTFGAVDRYMTRLYRMAEDLFDMQTRVVPVAFDALPVRIDESRSRVKTARERQEARAMQGLSARINAHLSSLEIEVRRTLRPKDDGVLKLARTIADLDDWAEIKEQHIDEARTLVMGKERTDE